MVYFFTTTLKPAFFGLQWMFCDGRGWSLISTSVLVTLSPFLVFQELINCCSEWVSTAETLNRWHPVGLCGYIKYVECITGIVAWFTPLWEEIWSNDGPASSREKLLLH